MHLPLHQLGFEVYQINYSQAIFPVPEGGPDSWGERKSKRASGVLSFFPHPSPPPPPLQTTAPWSEVGSRKLKVRSPKSERSGKSEVGSRKSEVRSESSTSEVESSYSHKQQVIRLNKTQNVSLLLATQRRITHCKALIEMWTCCSLTSSRPQNPAKKAWGTGYENTHVFPAVLHKFRVFGNRKSSKG